MDLTNVSELAGVYLWKDSDNNVIYVGKSKSLKNRMNQYFSGVINSFKTIKMVEKINSFETIVCNNENEALILERNLIQKYKPFYNVCLLDDKRYPYINVSINKNELLINLKYSVHSESKYNVFYGPYLNNGNSKIILNFLKRKCFYFEGLPIKRKNHEFWMNKFILAKNILSKNNLTLIKELKREMLIASNNEQFEIANDLKGVIIFLKHQSDVQIVDLKENNNFDVIAGLNYLNYILFCIHFYRNGSLINSVVHTIEIKISEHDTIRQFTNQFYQNKQIPTKIITNLNIDDDDLFFKSDIIKPKNGKYFQALSLCAKNAQENMEIKILEYKKNKELINGGLSFLKKNLNISNVNHIIMIDNSNTKNNNIISVIISYRNGIAQKNEYKKMNIISNTRMSDVEYIKQGVEKYFKNIAIAPNLLIVDGGMQQLNEAKKILIKKGFKNLPIVGLIKNENHKTECLILETGKKIHIEEEAYLFLSGMQIEVDRFAKYVHRNKNSKGSLEGNLIKINGIGPQTELKILNYFKTYNNIYNATLEELELVVSKNIAEKILKSFKH